MMKRLITATALTVLAALPASADTRVSIGTGGTGGVFYAIGAGMADILSKKLDGVTANAEVTGASVENVRRVSAGEMTLGFSSASTLYEGKNGQGPFEAAQNVAAVAYLYPAILQIAATKASGADGVEDLGDLRVSVGPPGSNSAVLAERLMTAYGVFDLGKVSFLSYTEATDAIKNGNLDASIILAGTPASAFIELTTTMDMTIVPVDKDKVSGLLQEYPFYEVIDIPGGVYAGADQPVPALGDPAILFTAADADPELVYQITKTLFDNLADVGAVHPAAKDIQRATATNVPVPLHEGAKRYFDEN
ncbi:TAXI family TRAP transporter solute-binding subunit [Polymorphum gilvum]|uniref:TRAP transporter solute receptor, TAXI family n=1 Tax=Polymorphum gilvum (strain LMG 25793 / CGMCC 1.9160 / SL003B-26A1) TaxID=991905 RepID=F2J6A3_POLGS|nr:TAXI family TRAP transporter solute-binding subunit [Polymorphum gilvum]ADZ71277.1 TRAP transporter solute receptor, TAXI family [Polymorphum gilvum SL003B-26A1]